MAEEAGWNPPNARELLEANIPDGSQWYEVRMKIKVLSYTVDRVRRRAQGRAGAPEGLQG